MDVAKLQIEAYNSQDLKSFLACYTDNIQVYMLHNNQLLTDGIEKLSEIMAKSFEDNPKARSTIISSINQGNLIIQREEIKNHISDKVIKTISIYELTDNKISKLWFGGRTLE
jgi:hypothetical protein